MSHYIHGSAPEEQQRLSLLNALMNARCVEKIQIPTGSRILDVGSGLGQFTHMLSQLSGTTGYCLGIERDQRQLEYAQRFKSATVEFRAGDAMNLPLTEAEAGTFDIVHARFLLEHLSDPFQAIQQMKKALRPGGKIILADDDHQAMILFPIPDGFENLWAAYMDVYIQAGNDPFIGRKLPKMLVDAGFNSVRNDTAFFGDFAGTKTFDDFSLNLIEVIGTARELMFENELISENAYQAAMDSLKKWTQSNQATIWYQLCFAYGTNP